MAGGGFLSSMFTTMVAKLHSLASPSTSSSSSSPHSNIEQEMSKLTETMRRIQAKLADSEEENHVKSHSEKLWLRELKDVAYDVEDVVAEYEYEPFENKWTRSSLSGGTNVTATQAQAQSQASDHKCTDPESCKKQIIEDFKNEAPLWKLTCYGHRKYGPCDVVGDISYEELRSAAYDDARQGLSVQSIVERERKLYLSKLNEFDNLLKKPYGSQSPSFHQMNSTPISSSPQMSQSHMLMNNASSVNVQGNNVPSFSSFSQLKATTNLGSENRSDPQGFPSGNFGQPSPFQKANQSSFGLGKFGNSGLFGQQPIQPAGNFPNPSVSSFNFAVRPIGSPSPQNFGGTNSQQLNSVSRAGTPSSDDEFEVDDGIWRKEEWKIGEIPERPPPAGAC